MKLKESGDYFELPIVGLKIGKFIFTGLLTLVFNDEENSYLDIHSSFKVSQHNSDKSINPREREGSAIDFLQ